MPWRELAVAWLHLAVLWGFAFAQPLFQVLADTPEFFVARRNTGGDIVVLACALILVPPTLLALIEALLFRLPRARRLLHLAFVAVLASVFVLQVLVDGWDGARAPVLIVLSAVAGAAVAFAYSRLEAVPTVFTVLSPVPLAFLLYFLLLSPVSDLVFPDSAEPAQRAAAGNGAPVVMVVFDEFSGATLLDRKGGIDRTRFPNFAELAEHSTWYRNAATVADRTTRAVPAILTGRVPPADALPTAADQPNSLFTLLGDRYAFRVEEPATDICPQRLCGEEARPAQPSRLRSLVSDLSVVSLHVMLPQELADDLPPIDSSFGNFRGRGLDVAGGDPASQDLPADAITNRTATFDRFLAGLGRDERRPTLHFLHSGLPHQPWEYLPDGTHYRLLRYRPPGERLIADPAPARQVLQQYMLQTVYVDRLLGRLMRRMRSLGLDRRAALVVTADHGISFRPDDETRSANTTNIGGVGGVPLFIKAPGQRRGRVDESAARTVDILPTLAADLGLEPHWRTDGRPLSDGGGPARGNVAVKTLFDKTTSVSFAQFLQARDAVASGIHDTFEPGVDGLFELSGDGALDGRALASLESAPARGATVEIDGANRFADVDPDASVLPLGVSGRIDGAGSAPLRLAIALNGRVAATTHAYEDRGELVFSALVPPSALQSGANDLGVFVVNGRPGATTLTPLRTNAVTRYRLTEKDGETVLDAPGGTDIRVEPGAVEGFVDGVRRDGSGLLTVSGWAIGHGDERADTALLFVGGRFLVASAPRQERPDVVEALGHGPLQSGFSLSAAVSEGGGDVRVFAIAGDRASELPQGEGK